MSTDALCQGRISIWREMPVSRLKGHLQKNIQHAAEPHHSTLVRPVHSMPATERHVFQPRYWPAVVEQVAGHTAVEEPSPLTCCKQMLQTGFTNEAEDAAPGQVDDAMDPWWEGGEGCLKSSAASNSSSCRRCCCHCRRHRCPLPCWRQLQCHSNGLPEAPVSHPARCRPFKLPIEAAGTP